MNFRNARADTAVRPYAEHLASVAQAIFVKTTHHIRAGTEACPYESLYQQTFQRDARWNVEREGR
jgi:hypothetical protein